MQGTSAVALAAASSNFMPHGVPPPQPTFGGNPNARVATIDTSGGIDMSRTSGTTPAFVQVTAANMAVTGGIIVNTAGATIAGATVMPFEDLEYTWNFGDTAPGGGQEIFLDPSVYPYTGIPRNANTDQTGPMAAYCYRDATGSPFTITLTIRGKDLSGNLIQTTKTAMFSVGDFDTTYTRKRYVDKNYGDDSYNGLAGTYNGTDGPYKTITKVLTAGTLDHIYFAQGSEWKYSLGDGYFSRVIASHYRWSDYVGAGGPGADPIFNMDIPTTITTTATTTNGSKIVAVTSSVGMYKPVNSYNPDKVTGTNIAANSTIATVDSPTQITLNNAATADGATTITVTPDLSKPPYFFLNWYGSIGDIVITNIHAKLGVNSTNSNGSAAGACYFSGGGATIYTVTDFYVDGCQFDDPRTVGAGSAPYGGAPFPAAGSGSGRIGFWMPNGKTGKNLLSCQVCSQFFGPFTNWIFFMGGTAQPYGVTSGGNSYVYVHYWYSNITQRQSWRWVNMPGILPYPGQPTRKYLGSGMHTSFTNQHLAACQGATNDISNIAQVATTGGTDGVFKGKGVVGSLPGSGSTGDCYKVGTHCWLWKSGASSFTDLGVLVGKGTVANFAALPGSGSVGDCWVTGNDGHLWVWPTGGTWFDLGYALISSLIADPLNPGDGIFVVGAFGCPPVMNNYIIAGVQSFQIGQTLFTGNGTAADTIPWAQNCQIIADNGSDPTHLSAGTHVQGANVFWQGRQYRVQNFTSVVTLRDIKAVIGVEYGEYYCMDSCYVAGPNYANETGDAPGMGPRANQQRNMVMQKCALFGLNCASGASAQRVSFTYRDNVAFGNIYFDTDPFSLMSQETTAEPAKSDVSTKVYRNKVYNGTLSEFFKSGNAPTSACAMQMTDNITVDNRTTHANGLIQTKVANLGSSTVLIDRNQYYTTSSSYSGTPKACILDNVTQRTFPAWQGFGYDLHGSFADPGWNNPSIGDFST